MKLVKQPDNLEFKWQDVTFKIKAVAEARDKFELDLLYEVDKTPGEVRIPRREMYLALIRQFVMSWSGVTDSEDKEVPFTLDALLALPPVYDEKGEVVMQLGAFIWKNTGISDSFEKKTTDTSSK